MNKKGFSLVELLIIIAIIMILTAIFIVSGIVIRERVKINRAQSFDKEVVLKLGYNLVGEWTFEDSSDWGKDTSGYFNNGLVSGDGISLKDEDDCPVGACLYLNGNDTNAISVAYDSSKLLFQDSTELTVSAWVKPTPSSFDGSYYIAANWDPGEGGYNQGWYLMVSDNDIYFKLYDKDSHTSSVSYDKFFTEFDEKWVHIVGVLKADEHVKLFFNGEKVATNSTGEEGVSYDNGFTDLPNFEIGSRPYDADGGDWHGYIDDVRVFREALSIAQVKDLYEEEEEKYQRLVLTE